MSYLIENVLSNEECIKFIEQIENKKNVVPFNITGKFINDKFEDNELAEILFNKVINKTKSVNINIKNLKKPNNLIMTAKYTPGMKFGLHTDTGLYYNFVNKEETRFTILFYLNDNFKGGETVFYNDDGKITKNIIPKKGSALIFDIDLWHSGKELLEGYKYWIGIEGIGDIK